MSFFSFLFKKKQKVSTESAFIIRNDEIMPADEVFRVNTSGDIEKMLNVVNVKTNLIDRHFLLQNIVSIAYKKRNQLKFREICRDFSKLHIKEFSDIAPALKSQMGGTLPRVTTFQYYATLLTEDKDFSQAISVCELAIEYGLKDNTKTGFCGRIDRIRKLQEKTV